MAKYSAHGSGDLLAVFAYHTTSRATAGVLEHLPGLRFECGKNRTDTFKIVHLRIFFGRLSPSSAPPIQALQSLGIWPRWLPRGERPVCCDSDNLCPLSKEKETKAAEKHRNPKKFKGLGLFWTAVFFRRFCFRQLLLGTFHRRPSRRPWRRYPITSMCCLALNNSRNSRCCRHGRTGC